MHPRVKKILTPLTKQELKVVDTHEGKFEFFRKRCGPCGAQTIHRFSIGDPIAIGTCQHEWDTTMSTDCPQPTLPLF